MINYEPNKYNDYIITNLEEFFGKTISPSQESIDILNGISTIKRENLPKILIDYLWDNNLIEVGDQNWN